MDMLSLWLFKFFFFGYEAYALTPKNQRSKLHPRSYNVEVDVKQEQIQLNQQIQLETQPSTDTRKQEEAFDDKEVVDAKDI